MTTFTFPIWHSTFILCVKKDYLPKINTVKIILKLNYMAASYVFNLGKLSPHFCLLLERVNTLQRLWKRDSFPTGKVL